MQKSQIESLFFSLKKIPNWVVKRTPTRTTASPFLRSLLVPFTRFAPSGAVLDTAIGFGLVSVAAVAAVFGKFLLGGLLAALALGVFVRLKRRTKS